MPHPLPDASPERNKKTTRKEIGGGEQNMSYPFGVLAMYLTGRRLEELMFYRKLCIYGQKLGLEVQIFTPDDVDESKSRILALTYQPAQGKWTRKWTRFPPLIYDRCRYHGADNFHKVTRFRRQYPKLQYLSRPLANKWTMHQILSENENIYPHMPSTEKYSDAKGLERFLKKHKVIFLKPKNGTGGRGIIRLQMLQGGKGCLMQGRDPDRRIIPIQKVTPREVQLRLNHWNLKEKYIVQQGIPLTLKDGRVHDFRMLVQKDGYGQWQITGCVGRVGPRQSVTSNLHGGGSAVPMETLLLNRFGSDLKVQEIKNSAYDLGLNVMMHLESKFGPLCEAGIDLAVDTEGHVWLLEVNPKPSREVFRRVGEKETYRKAIIRPLQYALWLLKKKKSAAKTGTDETEEPADPT